MKILRIALKNLNSLCGEHVVDLEEEPLASAGLFAITGATGAGKSTLLDAITLALYGRAARYGKEPNPGSMMSRHCGECSAEVTFSVLAGRYRAEWKLRRAGGKADGKLQPPQRYIYDSGEHDEQVLAQKIREADEMIEELVGLDYERFLRSALLAQGEFARFLKAGSNERAELLESLTGTAIYSELGMLVHEEATRRENKLQVKEAALDQIEVLTDEERKEFEEKRGTAREEKQTLQGVIEEGAEVLGQIKGLETAVEQEAKVGEERQILAEDRAEAGADLDRLGWYRQTFPFLADIGRLDGAEETYQNTRDKREEAEESHAEALREFGETTSVLWGTLKHAISEQEEKIEDAQKLAKKAKKKSEKAKEWLEAHAADVGLADQLPDLVAVLAGLKSTRKDYSQEWADLCKIAIELDEDGVERLPEFPEEVKKKELETTLDDLSEWIEKERQQSKEQRAAAEKDLKLRKDHWNKARLVADLEVHRASLVDGEPCPLCGSIEHPFAEGCEPDSFLVEIGEEVSRAETELENWKQRAEAAQRAGKEFAESRPKITQAQSEWTESRTQLTGVLKAFDLELPPAGEEDAMRKALQKREKDFQKQLKIQEEEAEAEQNAKKEEQQASGRLAVLVPKLEQLDGRVSEDLSKADDDDISERPSLQQVEIDWEDSKSKLNVKKAELDQRKKDEKTAFEGLGIIQDSLTRALKGSAFTGIDDLQKARLEQAEVDRIEEIAKDLDNRDRDLKTRLKMAAAQIVELREVSVPEGDAAKEFKERQTELQGKREALIRDITTWDNQLELDEKNRKRIAEERKELEEEGKDLAVWKRLRDLIGSHDGAKFRRYAQAISLDILVRHANGYLARLSDRYLIRRGKEEELQLEIEDLHQAGATRPMSSLSGGESFLASLALALGLSELAGRKVRIETLFIDEGFGSLDADTLDIAIGTLEGLQQDSKSIGVISHVDLLKQRITTQIIVKKEAAGVSTLRIAS
ncbi:MAG: AAA family ATPase [Gemmatimonadetes bacterium]|nr:AAA family ATPase [Gemmatimonadota bacterium]